MGVQARNRKLEVSASSKEITESSVLISNSVTPCTYYMSCFEGFSYMAGK